jgi:hypothetical protein
MEVDEEIDNNALNANNKGKQRQDPKLPLPRKFPPPRGGQNRISICVNDPAPSTSQVSNKEAALNNTARASTPRSNLRMGSKVNRPSSSKETFGSDATEENQEPNHSNRRRQKKRRLFFHSRLRGSDEVRTEALVCFSSKKKISTNSRPIERCPKPDEPVVAYKQR